MCKHIHSFPGVVVLECPIIYSCFLVLSLEPKEGASQLAVNSIRIVCKEAKAEAEKEREAKRLVRLNKREEKWLEIEQRKTEKEEVAEENGVSE